MNKSLLFCGLLAAGTLLNGQAANNRNLEHLRHNDAMRWHHQDGRQLLRLDDKAQTQGPRRTADYEQKGTINDAYDYGTLEAQDGKTWFWTAEFTPSKEFEFFYGSGTITLYDDKSQPVTTVTYQVPAGMKVNVIEPFGQISSKFYDTNSSTQEFTVFVHEVGENYTSIGHYLVYNTCGELVKEYDNMGNILWFDASHHWDTYQRAIFVTDSIDADQNCYTVLSVMKPASWNSPEPEEEHRFVINDDLLEFSYGTCLNMYNLNGEPYYVLSYYEKPFANGFDENFEIILNPDNNFVVEIYNRRFEQMSQFMVPVTSPEGAYCSMYAMGIFSYNDLQRGLFTDDKTLSCIITRMDVRMDTEDDTYPYAFMAYDQQGNHLADIAENVISWKFLTDIPGQPQQVGCLCLEDEGTSLKMVDLPSCQVMSQFGAMLDGRRITDTYDRYPTPDGYQYVMGIGEADVDWNNNVIGLIGWFDTEGKADHYVRFNLGPYGEYFTPLLEDYSLNPALFNTDDRHEYIYLAKKLRPDGSQMIDNVLTVADDKGKELIALSGNDERMLLMAAIIDVKTNHPRLVVGYNNLMTGDNDLEFYDLPFERFAAGGSGTADDPYLISSAGDLMQMQREPSANYAFANDVDWSVMPQSWQPVETFSGQLDGRGHSLKNLYLHTNESYVGLFSYLEDGASVKHLTFVDPRIELTADNRYTGLIAGMGMGCKLDSIFVIGLQATQTSATIDGIFGSLIGQATLYSSVHSSAVYGASVLHPGIIDLPSCSIVGGLVGETRTSSDITACSFHGQLNARTIVGGIVGVTGKGCMVEDCHVCADITAQTVVGGVVGDAGRQHIARCLVEGTLSATAVNGYQNACAGGIAGRLESDWEGKNTDAVIENNVVCLTSLSVPKGALGVHRIVGFTIEDEQYEEGERHRTEPGLQNNYALSSLSAVNAGSTTSDGLDLDELTATQLEALGFSFGHDFTAPWIATTQGFALYFEPEVDVLGIEELQAEPTQMAATSGRTVRYNLIGQPMAQSRGLMIQQGRIMMAR